MASFDDFKPVPAGTAAPAEPAKKLGFADFKPPEKAAMLPSLLKGTVMEAAALADIPLSLPAALVGVGTDVGARAAALGAGEPAKIQAQAGEAGREWAMQTLGNPVQKALASFGITSPTVTNTVMGTVGKAIDTIGERVEKATGGKVTKEDVGSYANEVMSVGGIRAPELFPKKVAPAYAEGVRPTTKAAPKPQAYPEFDEWLKVEEPAAAKPAGKIVVEPGYRPKTTPTPREALETPVETKPTRPEYIEPPEPTKFQKFQSWLLGESGKEPLIEIFKDEEDYRKEMEKRAELNEYASRNMPGGRGEHGFINPKLLARLAALGAGAALGAYADRDNPVIGAIVGYMAGRITVAGAEHIGRAFTGSLIEGQASRWLSDRLYTLDKRHKERQIQGLQYLSKVMPPDYPQHAEEIYHSFEDPSMKLSPRADAIKRELIDPVQAANRELRGKLEKLGVDVGTDIDQGYVHRVPIGKRSSVFAELEKSYPVQRNLPRTAPGLREREAYALVSPSGNREVITMAGPNKFLVWRNGKTVGRGKFSPQKPTVEWGGQEWTREQATTREIEAQTGIRYYKDALGTELDNNIRLGRALQNAQFLESLKALPSFKEIARARGESAPADWRSVDIDQLKGFKFSPRVADVLDDFRGEMHKHPAEALGKVSRIITGSLFWNPLPHIWNVLDHAIVQRGLSSWVTPSGYIIGGKTLARAWTAVATQNADYLRYLHEGAGLMYPNVLLRDYSAKVMQQLGRAPEMGAVAQAFGYANPTEMVRRIYQFSRETLWKANDVLMMQAYLEKEALGLKPQEAIRQVERHIPNYRVPDRVAGSRLISQYLQSPFFSAFGRYDYGRLRSYGEMIKDIVAKDVPIEQRARALDQMAMLSVMGLIVYPQLLDNAIQALTGNRNAKAGRFGASTVPYLLYEYLHGDQNLSQIVRSSLPQGPVLNLIVETWNNRDTFTGGRMAKSAADATSFLAKQFSPLYTAGRIQSGQMTPGQFVEQSLGARFPTSPEQRKELKQMRRGESIQKEALTAPQSFPQSDTPGMGADTQWELFRQKLASAPIGRTLDIAKLEAIFKQRGWKAVQVEYQRMLQEELQRAVREREQLRKSRRYLM